MTNHQLSGANQHTFRFIKVDKELVFTAPGGNFEQILLKLDCGIIKNSYRERQQDLESSTYDSR